MKYFFSILFLNLAFLSFSQIEKWQIGTKWVYDYANIYDGYYQLIVKGDTVIQTQNCLKLERTDYRLNQYFDSQIEKIVEKWEKETSFDFIVWHQDSILWYDKTNNDFVKLYDFTLEAGDSLRVNSDTYYKIENTKDSLIGGIIRRIQIIEGTSNSTIIEGIGSARDFFSPSDQYMIILEMRRNLLCFEQGDFNFLDLYCNPESLIIEEFNDTYLPFVKWIYRTTQYGYGDPFFGIDEFNAGTDTLLAGFYGKKINSSSGESFLLRHTKNGISYYFKNNWRAIARYDLTIGSLARFELLAQNPKTGEKDATVLIICKLETVDTLYTELGEKLRRYNFKVQNTSELEGKWVNINSYSFIEFIGTEYSFLPYLALPSIDIPIPLRCAYGSKDYFVSDYWKTQTYACDYVTSIESQNENNSFVIVSDQVHFLQEGNFMLIHTNGYVLADKQVTENESLDFSSFASGVYVIKFQNLSNEVFLSKMFVKN